MKNPEHVIIYLLLVIVALSYMLLNMWKEYKKKDKQVHYFKDKLIEQIHKNQNIIDQTKSLW